MLLTAGLFLSSVTFVLVICRVITLSDHQSVSGHANDSLCLSKFRSEIIYVTLPELFEVSTWLTSVLNYQKIFLPWRCRLHIYADKKHDNKSWISMEIAAFKKKPHFARNLGLNVKVKYSNFQPRTGHEGPEGE